MYGKINANVNSFPRKYVVNRIEATQTQSKSDCPVNIEKGDIDNKFSWVSPHQSLFLKAEKHNQISQF